MLTIQNQVHITRCKRTISAGNPRICCGVPYQKFADGIPLVQGVHKLTDLVSVPYISTLKYRHCITAQINLAENRVYLHRAIVEIFNNVNSGGTKLSKGDLALAKICGEWPQARDEMKKILAKYRAAGYDFSMEWLLRCITVYLTGQPYFNALSQITSDDVQKALPKTDQMIGTCLDHIGTRLGLDHARVLGGVFAIVTMIGYLRYNNWKLSGSVEWDKLLYWYVHSFLWGRYAGSTESALAQDLNTIKL